MDLVRQMESFVRVVDLGSLSAAARAEQRSLAAVSRQLSALESDLGVPLLMRTTRRLQLTEAGRQWHAHCVRILRELDDARKSVVPNRVRGRLTVSTSLTMGTHLLVPKLASVLRRHPELSVDLRLEDRAVDLLTDGVDLVIRSGLAIQESASLIARPLLTFPRITVAAPSYLRAAGLPRTPAALAGHEAIVQLGATGPLDTWHYERGSERASVQVRGRLRLSTPLAIREAARTGQGLAWLPHWLVTDDLAAGTLRHVLPKWQCPPAQTWALYRIEARGSPLIRAFLAVLDTVPATNEDE